VTYRKADVSSLRMLRRARDRIDRDYREEIAIAALASDAGYSREHFIRAFRAAYGDTPGRYRTRRRVERARELLRSANLTVTEICHLVGLYQRGHVQQPVQRADRHVPDAVSRGGRGAGRSRADTRLFRAHVGDRAAGGPRGGARDPARPHFRRSR
jgi:AraC-like DNA-binding protein